ncbi:MAG TPA: hypothetical protein PKM48_14200, partial [Parvularculaceae bacterium]|nr:hypothetical protein [Parvularculaceae bacterium]
LHAAPQVGIANGPVTDYASAKRADTVKLWHKISTIEDPEWTRRYHSHDPKKKAFGARVVVTFEDGSTLIDELGIANAHPFGARPFGRAEYIKKFKTLTDGVLDPKESVRFLDLVQRLPNLSAAEVMALNPVAPKAYLIENPAKGIF